MNGKAYIRQPNDPRKQKQIIILSCFVAALFFLLLTRLWYLQIVKAEDFQNKSESNRLRLVPVAASRGTIFDRNGTVLVSNRPSFSVAVIPQEVKDRDALLDQLSAYLDIDRAELLEKWEKGKGRARYHPIVLASGITRDQLELLEEKRLWLPGLEIEVKPVRQYEAGVLASHLLGYLGEVSDDELKSDAYAGYNSGDYIGKSGIERNWERVLHGKDGGRQIEVDARGRILRTLSETPPTVGSSLVLTIDAELQKRTEQSFGEQAGAAVVMDVNTGDILAFASNPDFDPALFTGRMPPEKWKEYLEDKRHPLENKALKGQYPPGSTFKIITALAGLEEGLIDEKTSVVCRGTYTLGASKFGCWERKGHGTVNLRRALKESCDVYFYQLGERLGINKIAAYARALGMGSPMGVGLDNEKGGLIPTSEWKEKRHKKKWLQGDTLPAAIGQGYVLMTPIQLASMIATVATDGVVYRPHLVKRIIDQDGRALQEFKPEVIARPRISARSFRLVKEGLSAVVNDPGGTGARARLYQVQVAGKTGTSQVVKLRDNRGGIPYQYRDHALFVAFAPYDKPEVAVAVVIEHGEHGGSAAAPIAGNILRAYFEGKGSIRKPVRKDVPSETGEQAGQETPASEQGGSASQGQQEQ
ncbi:penicillin-binding protein 2 [Geobacter metallireducens RCH3]|uniref:Peptidoglycan transpeptidase n=1 Tax=Geobacter metallireducens (strain ATCC 53774 / DSM 7210 / GS-15) TaxID=269799 RepID=Q39X54_GEOMG|nr:penicillin-binding protein 2 [Geobacter metallireducens]ABB31170.1 peptidoglycan transpeptidase [Geobacter metallireducens GS-15]EHP85348.1 penicillin-binding protein 2 [Geobacter metallireducens RCH3]